LLLLLLLLLLLACLLDDHNGVHKVAGAKACLMGRISCGYLVCRLRMFHVPPLIAMLEVVSAPTGVVAAVALLLLLLMMAMLTACGAPLQACAVKTSVRPPSLSISSSIADE
jgi:hypothetical protein